LLLQPHAQERHEALVKELDRATRQAHGRSLYEQEEVVEKLEQQVWPGWWEM
jgi:hypothetical protein